MSAYGKNYSARGWGVVNRRINDSRQKCPTCGHNTSIITLEKGRFCTWCFKNNDEYREKIRKRAYNL